jgi:hypothetical protein
MGIDSEQRCVGIVVVRLNSLLVPTIALLSAKSRGEVAAPCRP